MSINNKVTEPIFKSGLLYGIDIEIIQHAIKNKRKALAIIRKEKDKDKEPYALKRGNIFPNVNAPKNNPNEKIVFDILEDSELLGGFIGFLYSDGTLNGKIKLINDIDDGQQKNILAGFHEGNSFYGLWMMNNINYGFYGYLENDSSKKKKYNKSTSPRKKKSKKKVVKKRSSPSAKKLKTKSKDLRKRRISPVINSKIKKVKKRKRAKS
jgi:hypothetical protein